ncbi:hypothetical protein [Actinacidiphila acidipaludis]|uniref:Serine kinase n=1 Tax=Actinacidiphila acidipaludis TaxID=2873382 RepID=A0ABS7QGG2_9ACTN|nr:hypothetical protein [Streptomyces acidipaludis]MBY8882033.1 hypothetical protein [Streptomyces acidipaludis]
MPDAGGAAVVARFRDTTVEFRCPDPADTAHLRYYLSDHLVPEESTPELSVRLEAADGGSFTAALGTPATKRVWWRTPAEPWRLYEEWGMRARLPSPVPPFGLPPLRELVRIRHGAALAAPDGSGRALAITGASGAGKSVVLLHLMRRGWEFVSDDLLVMDRQDSRRLYCFGRPVGIRERSLPLLPWLDAALLADAPCLPTLWGRTWMVRAQRLGGCAPVDRSLRLAWRLHLTPGPRFTVRAEGPTTHATWDPQLHLEELLAVCRRPAAEGDDHAA